MQNAVIITGGGSGLGKSLAKLLRSKGESVITVDWAGDADVYADLSTQAGRESAIKDCLKKCPSPRSLVSNAGLSPIHEDALQILNVNWVAATVFLENFLKPLSEHPSGSAVAISSIGAAIGGDIELESYLLANDLDSAKRHLEILKKARPNDVGIVTYSTCKAALARYVRLNANAWGREGVRLNAIAPGRMETPMLEGLLADPEIAPGIEALPSGIHKSATSDAVAEVVEFFIHPRCSFIHGQVLYVDGGSEAILRPDLI